MISKFIGVTYFKNKLSKHSSKHDDNTSNNNSSNDTSFPTTNSTVLPSKRSSICISHRIKSKRNSSTSSTTSSSSSSPPPTPTTLTSSSTRKVVTRSQIRRSNTISSASALRHSLNVSNSNTIPTSIPKKLFSLPNSPSLTSDSTLNEPIDDIPHFYNTTMDINGAGNKYYGLISSTNNLMGRDGLLTLDLTTGNDTNSLFTTATREKLDNDLIIIDQQEQEEYNKGNEHMYGYGYGYELTNNTAVAAVEGTKIASLARSISKTKKKNVRFV